ncbi:hypothetical protein [Sediminibacterium goheungense]|uniref:Uncharacterized protein n=1 Tax=Sediminibacterium goheungense TaxID=1086393 RepID=A0A4R6J468_9BACT|nr:hypothetical protein [Sediminibacterium goheungense]TDO29086.1 hypothetical protein BC659_1169 [Sediminibacterium goheungense]
MDELKKYLQQNREALDADEPSPMVWERIQVQKPVKKKAVVITITRWAVAACVLVLAGIGTWSLWKDSNTNELQENPIAEVRTKEPKTKSVTEPIITNPESKTENTIVPNTTARTKKIMAVPKPVTERADLAILRNVESSFKQVINLQRNKVSTIPMYAESAEYFADFKTQIRQLEKDEKTVKNEIVKKGLTDDLLNQLINLYQIKLSTLKQLQTEMNKINNRVKQITRPVDSVKTYFIHI